jgi:hypothetical protein
MIGSAVAAVLWLAFAYVIFAAAGFLPRGDAPTGSRNPTGAAPDRDRPRSGATLSRRSSEAPLSPPQAAPAARP